MFKTYDLEETESASFWASTMTNVCTLRHVAYFAILAPRVQNVFTYLFTVKTECTVFQLLTCAICWAFLAEAGLRPLSSATRARDHTRTWGQCRGSRGVRLVHLGTPRDGTTTVCASDWCGTMGQLSDTAMSSSSAPVSATRTRVTPFICCHFLMSFISLIS